MAKLRRVLSVGEGYNTNDMMRKIINPAIDKINEVSSINVTNVEKIKKDGKNISSLKFLVEFQDVDLNFKDAMRIANEGKRLLSDAQILKYAIAIVEDPEFAAEYKQDDEDVYKFLRRISEELTDNEKVMEFYPYLQKTGFVSKNLERKLLKEDDSAEDESPA